MVRYIKIFLLALCVLLGLAACSGATSTPTPTVPTLPVGQAAFLISYADW
jgi:hypothetical protein